jgi:3-oxoacyl-[acyl-carrier-protein] synthase-3
MGYVIPENVVTSAWIEEQLAPVYKKMRLPMGFLERLTGIKERRWWDEGVWMSDAAAMAAEKALAHTALNRRLIEKDEIQCLINASVCRDYIEPATATIAHHKIGLSPSAMCFDVINACLGFLNGMVIVADMIELGHIDTGMVVAAEGPREGQLATIERMLADPPSKAAMRDNLATFTLGAASVAMILRHKDKSQTGKRLLGGYAYSNTEHNQLCVAQRTWMRTNSSVLLDEGTQVVVTAWEGFKKVMGWDNGTVDKLFTHQVSEPQRRVGLRAMGLSLDIDYPTLSYLGNTASVAAPISMAIAYDKGLVNDGDKVALLGVGSGINSLILGIQS